MEELRKALESVIDTYDDFIDGLCNLLSDDEEQAEKLIQYIRENPEVQTDDCIEFLNEYIENLEYEEE